jgi:hypothetical protein
MVHDEFPSDMWWHDAMTEFSIISNWHKHLEFKYKHLGYLDEITPSIVHEWSKELGKVVPVDWNADKLTHYERILRGVEKQGVNLEARFSESLVLAGYHASVGLITQDEYNHIEEWYDTANKLLSNIVRNFRMIRGWKSMPDEEYDIVCESIENHIPLLREAIRDRYIFEREVELRARSSPAHHA